MTTSTPPDNSFQSDQTPSHAAIFARTGSGKSILIAPIWSDEIQKRDQMTKE